MEMYCAKCPVYEDDKDFAPLEIVKSVRVGAYGWEDAVAACEADINPDTVAAVAAWLTAYGNDSWNGEYYDAFGFHRLYPVYADIDDAAELVGYYLD